MRDRVHGSKPRVKPEVTSCVVVMGGGVMARAMDHGVSISGRDTASLSEPLTSSVHGGDVTAAETKA